MSPIFQTTQPYFNIVNSFWILFVIGIWAHGFWPISPVYLGNSIPTQFHIMIPFH
ncbi:hypothetical protein Lalb_Chr12g0207051 [Lupinus albus]|uniref:Uncharacterized protein n=1 Tax=Lupinus albus TaxID=3870 RepID=A0A6A4PNR2_LUPAL|nr:hypothetical protein Lalb_Chr12g0207051 [Lupinus albus]